MASTDDSSELVNRGPVSDREQLVDGGSSSQDGQQLEASPLQLDSPAAEKLLKQSQEGLKVVVISCICFAVTVTVALVITIAVLPPQFPPHGGVASDRKECSDIGVQLLKDGGSAVDAAIGCILCLGVLQPTHAGLGSGGVMLLRTQKTNENHLIDFLSSAPAAWDPASQQKGQNIAVPGLLRGLELAHQQFGKLSWEDVITPVIDLADNSSQQLFAAQSDLDYAELAGLLQDVASDGSDAFYTGDVADDIVAKVSSAGGRMTLSDLSEYTAVSTDPVSSTFLDSTLLTSTMPTDGPILLLMLNVLTNLTTDGVVSWNSRDLVHYMIEVMKFAYAERAQLLMLHNSDNNASLTNDLLSKEYASLIAARIDGNKTLDLSDYFLDSVPASLLLGDAVKQTGSSHVSVVGPDDDFVAITVSLNDVGGSKQAVRGFYLNNQLKERQVFGDNQRAVMLSGLPVLTYKTKKACGERIAGGAAGGYFTAAGLAEVLVRIIGLEMNVSDAVNSGRVYSDVETDTLSYGGNVAPEVQAVLRNKGHERLEEVPLDQDPVHVNIMAKQNETVWGSADDMRNSGGSASVY